MPFVHFSFDSIPAFAKALREAAPKHLLKATGRAFYRIGKSDIEKFKNEQLSGGRLNVRSKGFINSFKFRATDARKVKSVGQLELSEYTGAKPFRIFQTGGDISPAKAKVLTILTDSARNGQGTRKITQKELSAMISAGQAKIIQTKAGPAVIKVDERTTKSGKLRTGSKATILAWLKPRVTEEKRIDFFGNFTSNAGAHEAILNEAAEEAIARTIADEEYEEYEE
jgi:hypothetical protein